MEGEDKGWCPYCTTCVTCRTTWRFRALLPTWPFNYHGTRREGFCELQQSPWEARMAASLCSWRQRSSPPDWWRAGGVPRRGLDFDLVKQMYLGRLKLHRIFRHDIFPQDMEHPFFQAMGIYLSWIADKLKGHQKLASKAICT